MFRRLACAVALAAASISCSGPPTAERQQAENALTAARAAGAASYAPAELKAAETMLSAYDAAVADRDYRQALRLALDARDGAYQAAKRATEEKAVVKGQAEQLMADLDELLRGANARLSGTAGPRPAGQTADRIRAAVKTASSALQEAGSSMKQENYRAVVSSLSPASASLRKDIESAAPSSGRRGR